MTMALLTPTPSPELKLVTKLKIDEFERIREDARSRHLEILTMVQKEGGEQRERVASLLEKIKKLGPDYEDDYELSNMEQYLKQAAYDRSISSTKLDKFETVLLDKFRHHRSRMELGSLYAKLLTEWIEMPDPMDSAAGILDRMSMEDEFELIEEGEIEQLREHFDSITFSPLETDAEGIEKYLSKFFTGSAGTTDLENLRRSMEHCGEDILDEKKKFTEENVTWTIKDILKNVLISAEKRRTLNSYLQSPVVLKELISTLTLRYSNVANWSWRDPEKGLRVEARQNLEGKYCMVVDEDILDLVFLHVMATKWSASVKDSFRDIVNSFAVGTKTWKRSEMASPDEQDKRDYYLLAPRRKPKANVCTICHTGPPPPPLGYGPPPPPPGFPRGPPPPPPGFGRGPPPPPPGIVHMGPPPPPPPMRRNDDIIITSCNDRLDEERHHEYMRDLFSSQLPGRFRTRYGARRNNKELPEVEPPNAVQEIIIKKLPTEMLLREALDGEVCVIMHNFKFFATELPHSTILAVLKFMGVSEVWLTFFKRFLEAPLNMGPIIRGTADQVRTRKRGVPIGHAFERFFGETVLFFLDLAINQNSGIQQYRIRDEGWLCGKADMRYFTIQAMEEFTSCMGLTLTAHSYVSTREAKSANGEISLGYLKLSLSTGKWQLDDTKIDTYIRLVRAQLAACTSTLSWIETWNTLVCDLSHAIFGAPVFSLGKDHLDDVLAAYHKIHAALFTGENGVASSLTEHIKQMLHKIPDCPDISDAFIYLPQSFGGLGVKNPYVDLTLASELPQDPSEKLQTYLKEDRAAYEKAKDRFGALTEAARARKLDVIYPDKEKIAAAFPDGDTATFMPYEEWAKWREPHPMGGPNLYDVYLDLMRVPEADIEGTRPVTEEVRRVRRVQGSGGSFWSLEIGERWAIQLYAEECFEQFGGLCLVEKDWLPLQALKMMRGQDADDDDDVSIISSDY